MFDVLGSLGQDHPNHSSLILDSLSLLGSLEDRDVKDKGTTGRLAKEVLGIGVPADGEGILPAAEDGVPGLDLQQGLPLVAAEPRCRNVADHIRVVRVHTANPKGKLHLLQRMRDGVIVPRLGVLDSVELARQVGSPVFQVITFLKGDVASPVADLNVPLQARNMDHRLVELESHLDMLGGSGRLLVKRSIDELGALLLGELLDVAGTGKLGIIGNGRGRELDFGLLLGGGVGRRAVRRERVAQELYILLLNGSGKGLVCVKNVIADADGLRGAGLERAGQPDAQELDITARTLEQFSWVSMGLHITNLAGSSSVASATNGPAASFLRSFTSTPPRRDSWSAEKGRKYSFCGALSMFSITTLMFSLT